MITQQHQPIRVAQVVAGMVPAGLETWLMRVLRNIDRSRFQFDFITHTADECFFDEEIRALGARILPCTPPARAWHYARSLRRILREYGPYDVVHSHLHHFSGYVLRVAEKAGVPRRIAHSHSDTRANQATAPWLRRLYLRTTERWVQRHATRGFAVSDPAGAALFPAWNRDERWEVLYCGIELDPFLQPLDRSSVRAMLGLPHDALVLGHVGTMREPKNHLFLVEIAAAAMAREPRARLLLVGEGPKRPEIEARIRELGITDRVVMTGLVRDPLQYLRGAMDALVFPSLWEGLPLSVLEAQAAGLPCILSDVIAREVEVVEKLVTRMSLSDTADRWAAEVLRSVGEMEATVRTGALAQVEASPFNIKTCVKQLEKIYAQR